MGMERRSHRQPSQANHQHFKNYRFSHLHLNYLHSELFAQFVFQTNHRLTDRNVRHAQLLNELQRLGIGQLCALLIEICGGLLQVC